VPGSPISSWVVEFVTISAVQKRYYTLNVTLIVKDSFFNILGIECLICAIQVAYATDSQEVLFRVARQLFNSFGFGMYERTVTISMGHF